MPDAGAISAMVLGFPGGYTGSDEAGGSGAGGGLGPLETQIEGHGRFPSGEMTRDSNSARASWLNDVSMIQDLVSWDGSDMADSRTIKGLAAELAACIGPDLVERTMLEF